MYSRVYIEITNICNMNCSFCHGHKRALMRMSEEQFLHILDNLCGQTKYIYYHLMGEPLTHPELGKFISLASERGFKSMITTNGTLLGARGEELIASGLHKINVSLHSFEGEDEQKRNGYLLNVAKFAKKASEAGVIVVLRLWNRGFDGGKNDEVTRFLTSYFDGEWTENNRGMRISERLFLEWGDRFEWPDREAPQGDDNVACYGMRDHFGILCDGTVVPCCLDSDGVISLGNVFDAPLSEILSSDRAKAIKHGFECRRAAEELCRRCGYARRF